MELRPSARARGPPQHGPATKCNNLVIYSASRSCPIIGFRSGGRALSLSPPHSEKEGLEDTKPGSTARGTNVRACAFFLSNCTHTHITFLRRAGLAHPHARRCRVCRCRVSGCRFCRSCRSCRCCRRRRELVCASVSRCSPLLSIPCGRECARIPGLQHLSPPVISPRDGRRRVGARRPLAAATRHCAVRGTRIAAFLLFNSDRGL